MYEWKQFDPTVKLKQQYHFLSNEYLLKMKETLYLFKIFSKTFPAFRNQNIPTIKYHQNEPAKKIHYGLKCPLTT